MFQKLVLGFLFHTISLLSVHSREISTRELFDLGDYTAIKTSLEGQNFSVAENCNLEQMVYLIAATPPFVELGGHLTDVVAAINLNQRKDQITGDETNAKRLWKHILDLQEIRETNKKLSNLVIGLLHLRNQGDANIQQGLSLLTQNESRHAKFWLGYIYSSTESPIANKILEAISYFSQAGMHMQAMKSLNEMGITIDDPSLLINKQNEILYVSKATRENILRNVIEPALIEETKYFANNRKYCLICSNTLEVLSVICAGTATALAYGGFKGDPYFALAAGITGTVGLVFKGFSHFTSGESKEITQHLNSTLKYINVNSMPMVSNTSADQV